MEPDILLSEPDVHIEINEMDVNVQQHERTKLELVISEPFHEKEKTKSFLNEESDSIFDDSYISKQSSGNYSQAFSEEQDKTAVFQRRAAVSTSPRATSPILSDNTQSSLIEKQTEEARQILDQLGGKPKLHREKVSNFNSLGPRLRIKKGDSVNKQ